MQCLVAKPIVDGIEKELGGRARVVRMNVINQEGREAAQRYGIRGLPSTVVLDGAGDVIDVHAGIPSRKKIVAQATG
jgi:thioredoxin-like negative regulator of GroEL